MIISAEEVSGKEFPAQEHLNYLMVLHVHNETTDSLNIKSIINAFQIIVQTFLQNLKQNELHYHFI